jgi:DNA-directed RNA polymerase specialized sigma subunit
MEKKEYLQNYQSYKIAIINLKRKRELFGSLSMEESNTLKSYEWLVESVDRAMEHLTEVEQSFIQLKYFQRMRMTEIEKHLPYSQRNLFQIQRSALKRLNIGVLDYIT